jgi:hypothetical protein
MLNLTRMTVSGTLLSNVTIASRALVGALTTLAILITYAGAAITLLLIILASGLRGSARSSGRRKEKQNMTPENKMDYEKRIQVDQLMVATTTYMRRAMQKNIFREPTWEYIGKDDHFVQAESNIITARAALKLAANMANHEDKADYVRRGCEDLIDAMNRLAFVVDNELRILGLDPGIHGGVQE